MLRWFELLRNQVRAFYTPDGAGGGQSGAGGSGSSDSGDTDEGAGGEGEGGAEGGGSLVSNMGGQGKPKAKGDESPAEGEGGDTPPDEWKPPAWMPQVAKKYHSEPYWKEKYAENPTLFFEEFKRTKEQLAASQGNAPVFKKDMTAEQRAAYDKAVGVPADIKEYGAKLPESWLGAMKAAGVSKEQAAIIDGIYAETQKKARDQALIDERDAAEAATDALKTKYRDKFDDVQLTVKKAFSKFVPPALLKEINASPLRNSVGFIEMMHEIGQLLKEDVFVEGGVGDIGEIDSSTAFTYDSKKK